MMSNRGLAVLSVVAVSLLLLAISSNSLGYWEIDQYNFDHIPGFPPTTQQHGHHRDNGDAFADGSPENEDRDKGNDQPLRPHDQSCDSFPDTSNLLVVMKTGASESYSRIPTQLMTTLKCLPEFYIFSDLEETVAGYRIRDSLDTVLPGTKDGNRDFDLYRRQQNCSVDVESCNKLAASKDEGWQLDKYKNVHIAEKVYALRPGYDWYLFIDADTYVLFPTLMRWLPRLDPSVPHHLGSIAMLRGYAFAHGGSGYLVSQGAMKGFGDNPGIANEMEPHMRDECCGDYVFSLAAENTTGVRVRNMWPTVNGEKPFTLPFAPDHWCQPLVTMHHLNSEEVSSVHAWEASSGLNVTRIKDVYKAFVEPRLSASPVRDDWDNRAEDRFYFREDPDPESRSAKFANDHRDRMPKPEDMSAAEEKAHESFEDCGRACAEMPRCLSYRWQDGLCGLAWSFRMGEPKRKAKEERKRWRSGWDLDHIRALEGEKGECADVDFPAVPSRKPSQSSG